MNRICDFVSFRMKKRFQFLVHNWRTKGVTIQHRANRRSIQHECREERILKVSPCREESDEMSPVKFHLTKLVAGVQETVTVGEGTTLLERKVLLSGSVPLIHALYIPFLACLSCCTSAWLGSLQRTTFFF